MSGKGTVAVGGMLNALFSVGELMGLAASGILMQRGWQPWYVLTISRCISLASAAAISFASSGGVSTYVTSLTGKLANCGRKGDIERVAGLLFAGASSGATNGALMVGLLESTVQKGQLTCRDVKPPLTEPDKAIMYGVYHLMISVGNLLSTSILSSILQNETAAHLKANLDHKVSRHLLKVELFSHR